jgi:bacterioferritin-associated ferredoxin
LIWFEITISAQNYNIIFPKQNYLTILSYNFFGYYCRLITKPRMETFSKYICQCKSVKKNEIIKSIRKNGAETLLDIQNLTKAATGCGRCKDEVMGILEKEMVKKSAMGKQLRIDF